MRRGEMQLRRRCWCEEDARAVAEVQDVVGVMNVDDTGTIDWRRINQTEIEVK